MNVVSTTELRSIIDQRDSLNLILEIFCSIETPNEETREQIEVLFLIAESYENLIESLYSIEDHYKLYKEICEENRSN